jgi:CelD/BcsL family acetyltransferase involved in cellulose biosynthesis
VARGPGGAPRAGIALVVSTLAIGPARVRVGTWLGHPRRVFQPDLLAAEGASEAAVAVLGAALEATDGLVLHDARGDGWATAAAAVCAPWARRAPGRPSLVVPAGEPALGRRRKEVAYEIRRARGRGAEIGVEVAADQAGVEAALEVLIELHLRRWEGRPDVSRFTRDERDRALHRRAIASGARAGMVRVAVVREDGRPVAALAGLVAGGGGMLYRLAAAPARDLRGPGIVAIVATIDALLEAGASRVDLGIGQEVHKRRLGPVPVPSTILTVAVSRRWQPALTLAIEGRRLAREGLRRARAATTRGGRSSASGRPR